MGCCTESPRPGVQPVFGWSGRSWWGLNNRDFQQQYIADLTYHQEAFLFGKYDQVIYFSYGCNAV